MPSDPRLLERLIAQGECEWVEFKKSWLEPTKVGRYASALANGARLNERPHGYLVWGLANDGSVVGTVLDPRAKKVGEQPFEFWLKGRLGPKGHAIRIFDREHEGHRLVVLEVEAAQTVPVRFNGVPYIRIGDATPKLEDHPDREKRLLELLVQRSFEGEWARENLTGDEVVELLDVPEALRLLEQPSTGDTLDQLDRLRQLRLLDRANGGFWSLTNQAVVLFARRLSDFGDRFNRRVPRVIFYEGQSRIKTRYEQTGVRGYALGFEGLFEWLESHLPTSEQLRGVLRVDRPMYPIDALRELVANALIHQDFSVSGAGPMIEVFADRIEISNPGTPLIDVDRLLDEPARSRNERLAYLMRLMRYCEERGSGIDKVVFEAEVYQLPPPAFEIKRNGFIATLFAPRSFNEMTPEERTRAIYQHACLRWVSGNRPTTNSTIRGRFGFGDERATQVSRLIADALDAGAIKPIDPSNRSRAQAAYQPFWA
jgi:ATP-dependent DNA helicase RecG